MIFTEQRLVHIDARWQVAAALKTRGLEVNHKDY